MKNPRKKKLGRLNKATEHLCSSPEGCSDFVSKQLLLNQGYSQANAKEFNEKLMAFKNATGIKDDAWRTISHIEKSGGNTFYRDISNIPKIDNISQSSFQKGDVVALHNTDENYFGYQNVANKEHGYPKGATKDINTHIGYVEDIDPNTKDVYVQHYLGGGVYRRDLLKMNPDDNKYYLYKEGTYDGRIAKGEYRVVASSRPDYSKFKGELEKQEKLKKEYSEYTFDNKLENTNNPYVKAAYQTFKKNAKDIGILVNLPPKTLEKLFYITLGQAEQETKTGGTNAEGTLEKLGNKKSEYPILTKAVTPIIKAAQVGYSNIESAIGGATNYVMGYPDKLPGWKSQIIIDDLIKTGKLANTPEDINNYIDNNPDIFGKFNASSKDWTQSSKGWLNAKDKSNLSELFNINEDDLIKTPDKAFLNSLLINSENFYRVKNKYNNLDDNQTLYRTINMYNAPGTTLKKEYGNYYGPKEDIDYSNKVIKHVKDLYNVELDITKQKPTIATKPPAPVIGNGIELSITSSMPTYENGGHIKRKKKRARAPFYYTNPADYGMHDTPVAYFQEGGSIPNRQDSLDLYNNSQALLNYYSTKNKYIGESLPMSEDYGKRVEKINAEIREDLRNQLNKKIYPKTSRSAYILNSLKQKSKGLTDPYLKSLYLNEASKYLEDTNFKMSDYYKPVNINKYYQRETANAILDLNSPKALYDKRITPNTVYDFTNRNEKSLIMGDEVGFYGYDPLSVKPYDMLTAEEKQARLKKYGTAGFPNSSKKSSDKSKTNVEHPINAPAKGIIDKLYSTEEIQHPRTRGGQDFKPVDRIMGPSGQTLYRKDYPQEVWEKMAPTRDPVIFQEGGSIPNQPYLGLQQAAQNYWNQGGYTKQDYVNSLATGKIDYAPIDPITDVLLPTGILKNSKLLKNIRVKDTHKINPWAFKPNPDAYYRGIGRKGYEDALKNKVIRPTENYDRLYFTDEIGHTNMYAADNSIYKEDPLGGNNWKMIPPKDPRKYIVEIPKDKLPNAVPISETKTLTSAPYYTSIDFPSIDDVKFYREHWLKGYKEITKDKNKSYKYQTGGSIPRDNTTVSQQQLNNQSSRPWFETQYPRSMSKKEVFDQTLVPALQFGLSSAMLPRMPRSFNNVYQEEFTNKLRNIQPRNYTHTPNKWLHTDDSFGIMTPGTVNTKIKKHGGVITDNQGQYNHPGEVTRINSNNITMKGIPYNVLGVPDNGAPQLMQPNQDYNFPKANYVTEYPMKKSYKKGGRVFYDMSIPIPRYQNGGITKSKSPTREEISSYSPELQKLYETWGRDRWVDPNPGNNTHPFFKQYDDYEGYNDDWTPNLKLKGYKRIEPPDTLGDYIPNSPRRMRVGGSIYNTYNGPAQGGQEQAFDTDLGYHRGTSTNPGYYNQMNADGTVSSVRPETNWGQVGSSAMNYSTAAAGAASSIMNNVNNPNLSTPQKYSRSINSTVDAAASVVPVYGQIYAGAKTLSDTGRSFVPKDEKGEAKTKGWKSAEMAMTPVHEQAINYASEGKWGDAALTTVTGGVYGDMKHWFAAQGGQVPSPSSPRYTTYSGTTYQDPSRSYSYNPYNPNSYNANTYGGNRYPAYFAQGGQTELQEINVEKDELNWNKKIKADYKHLPPHPEFGMNPDGTVLANEGDIIIPKSYRSKFLNSDKATKDRIINTVMLAQQQREKNQEENQEVPMARTGGRVEKYQDRGRVTSPMRDPYYNFNDPNASYDFMNTPPPPNTAGPRATVNPYADQYFMNAYATPPPPKMGMPTLPYSPARGAYAPEMNSVSNPGAYFEQMNKGRFDPSQYYDMPGEIQPHQSGWSKAGNMAYNMLPYIGDAAQMANALFSKPKYGSRLRNTLGREYLDKIGGKYNPATEARANREMYLAARGSLRDMTGGSTGAYLGNMSNLASNAYKANSDIYTRAHNIDMQNAYAKAEYARALGSEDAGYQGMYEQDKLMAEAKRREGIFAPMQNMGRTALIQDQYSRLYPRYSRLGGRV